MSLSRRRTNLLDSDSSASSHSASSNSDSPSDHDDHNYSPPPLAAAAAGSSTSTSHKISPAKPMLHLVDTDSEDEAVLFNRPSSSSTTTLKRTNQLKSENEDSEDEPIRKRPKKKSPVKPAPQRKRATASASARKPTLPSIQKIKRESLSSSVKSDPSMTTKSEYDDDFDATSEFKWWQDSESMNDTSIKWTTLSHNGVLFPPEYVPHHIQIKYKDQPIQLGPAAEEMATFYAGIIGTQHEANDIFRANFFTDFLDVIRKTEPKHHVRLIKSLEECDFSEIVDHLNSEKERKKLMTKDEKNDIKKEKADIDEQYGWAMIDGRKEKIGNFRVEPPGLFRGRGAHPKAGKLKSRIRPEDITLNIGENERVPDPPAGHQWRQVVHDQTVTWLATWIENVNNQTKYVFLSATSSWKGMSDLRKFEKARELKKYVVKIRKDYMHMLRNKEMVKRQLATALYFIDQFALRAGNEKSDDEADTVGCCSLRYEHVTLSDPDVVTFDFLGKDSIRYYNEVHVDAQVHKNLRLFKKNHKIGDSLFDRIDTSSLNKYLQSLMSGLTAKVFRTYNASHTFQVELQKTPAHGSVAEKVLAYNRANRQVAVLCNHQRTVPKTFDLQISRMVDKLKALKYERRTVRHKMLAVDPKLKKTRKDLCEDESDLDDEWIDQFLVLEEARNKERDAKKLAKLNAARADAGEPELDELPLASMREPSLDTLNKKFDAINVRIATFKLSMVDKNENKTTALGTSKINYIDPRISAAWCAKYDVPIERLFPKTLRDKFKWAMDVDGDWEF